MMRQEGTAAAVLALGLGIGLALVVDLSSPRKDGGHASTTAPSIQRGEDLAARMEAQIAAGAPGVALALEEAATAEARGSAAVSAARARAQFGMGDAPKALRTVRLSLRSCEAAAGCTHGERASLARLEMVFSALVAAGIVDPRANPARVDETLRGLLRPAAFAQ